MHKLSHYAKARDNNFNLIRLIAASAVLVSHCFALSSGSPDYEPLRLTVGVTIASIAVDVFFIASGFLVTSSLLSRRSVSAFIRARALRLYPALIVAILLTVAVLGTYFTTLPLPQYLISRETLSYLAHNASLLLGVRYDLPGVFEQNPYRNAVNGSLWTLPFEIRMYLILAALWAVTGFMKDFRQRAFDCATIALFLASGVAYIVTGLAPSESDNFLRLFYMFFTGAAYFVCRDRVSLSGGAAWALLLTMVLAALHGQFFFPIYCIGLAYIFFALAYLPGGFIRRFNLLGDYSYGVYIYAFPVQQAIAALIPGVTASTLLTLSGFATLLLAVLSWHFLEKRALALKDLPYGSKLAAH